MGESCCYLQIPSYLVKSGRRITAERRRVGTFSAVRFGPHRGLQAGTKCEFGATARMAAVGQLPYYCPRFDRDLTTGQMVISATPLSKADFRDTPDHLQIALDVAFVLTYEV